ncbi:MAG: hypothetical protein MPJ24_02380 [Pirellulaceae bacterium]|nr:hypothetical protein [Pirellulaceae bacterium]
MSRKSFFALSAICLVAFFGGSLSTNTVLYGQQGVYTQTITLSDSGETLQETSCGCNTCEEKCGRQGLRGRNPNRMKKLGPMPQTCYSPTFGCYPGNSREIHRYPAFHGTYYRKPYNYRNLFDYPWHADLHEPVSLFTYNVAIEEEFVKASTSFDNRQQENRLIQNQAMSPQKLPSVIQRISAVLPADESGVMLKTPPLLPKVQSAKPLVVKETTNLRQRKPASGTTTETRLRKTLRR